MIEDNKIANIGKVTMKQLSANVLLLHHKQNLYLMIIVDRLTKV